MTENAIDMAKQTAQASMDNIKDLYDLAHKEGDEVDEDEERPHKGCTSILLCGDS